MNRSDFDLEGGFVVGVVSFTVVYVTMAAVGFVQRPLFMAVSALRYLEDGYWFFTVSHLQNLPGVVRQIQGIGGDSSFLWLTYLVPPFVLSLAGYRLTRYSSKRTGASEAVKNSASITVGYLTALSVVSAFLYLNTPILTQTIYRSLVYGGVLYPVVFGGLGGVIAYKRYPIDEDPSGNIGKSVKTGHAKGTETVNRPEQFQNSGSDGSYGLTGTDTGSGNIGGNEVDKKGKSADKREKNEDIGERSVFPVPGASRKQERRMAISAIIAVILGGIALMAFGSAAVFPFCLVLSVLFIYGVTDAWLAERYELDVFKETEGTVVETDTVDQVHNRKKPLVRYRYDVEREEFVNDKIWPGKPMAKQMSRKGSSEFLSNYQEGSSTTVYHSPFKPEKSFIERSRTTFWHIFVLLVGIGLYIYSTSGFAGLIPAP